MTDTATKLMLAYQIPRILGLSLAHIYEMGIVSRSDFQDALSSFSTTGAVSTKNVDIVIHRLRDRLRDYGIQIHVVRTVGITLPRESRDLIEDAIRSYDQYYGSKTNALDARDAENGKGLHEGHP